MGIYLNPGNENFAEVVKAQIYVDKTLLIKQINSYLNTPKKFVCVSRPRRFGKTIAGNMLSAYYSKSCNSTALFSPFKIAKENDFKKNLNSFNVIKLDLNGFYSALSDKNLVFEEFTQKIKKIVLQKYIKQIKSSLS